MLSKVRFVHNSLLKHTYICIILFEGLHIVEVVHDLFLIPSFNICHEVDPSGKISIVILTRIVVVGTTLIDLMVIFDWMAVAAFIGRF